ncbi:hypothetical protein GCM10027026_41560 [Myroides odoratimimus subsp. xuanwuensis]
MLVQEIIGEGFTAEAHAGLTELASRVDVRVHIALVARPSDVTADRPADELVRVLHLRLDEPGLYLAATESHDFEWAAYDVDPDGQIEREVGHAHREIYGDECCHTGLSAAGEAALVLHAAADGDISEGDLDAVLSESAYRMERSPSEWSAYEPDPWRVFAFPIALALVAGLLAYAVARSWRRPKASARTPRSSVAPDVAVPAPTEQATAQLTAKREVRKLAKKLARADVEHRGHAEASACLAQAERLLSSEDVLSLVGSLTLARTGARALTDDPPYRCCYFDPRHGEATARTTFAHASVPSCTRCHQAVEGGGAPGSLTVEQTKGRRVAYWKLDSVWSHTGFGSLVDDYADQVILDREAR